MLIWGARSQSSGGRIMQPIKSAEEKIADLRLFIPKATNAILQFQALLTRLETDSDFRKLWNRDSGAALSAVGIDPEARRELGLGPYEDGAQCVNCITPGGNACHC